MNLSAVFSDKLADEYSDIEDDGDFTNIMKASADIDKIAYQNDIKVMQYEQLSKLIDTIQHCGIDKSLLYMFNKNNELSTVTHVSLPSLEDFTSIDQNTCNQVIEGLSFAGDESFANMMGDLSMAMIEDFIKPFSAGYRWLQSLNDYSGAIEKVKDRLNTLKKNKNVPLQGNLNAPDMQQFKKALQIADTDSYREQANTLMKNLTNNKFFGYPEKAQSAARQLRKMAAEIDAKYELIDNLLSTSVKNYNTLNLDRLKVSDVEDTADKIFERLNNVKHADKTYPGYWKIGTTSLDAMFHAGWKMGDIFTSLSTFLRGIPTTAGAILMSPTIFSLYWNRGVIGIATNGWRVLSKSADLDYHIFSRFRFTLNRILYHNLKDLV